MQKAGLLGAVGGTPGAGDRALCRLATRKVRFRLFSFPEREAGAAGVLGEETGLLLSPAASTFTLRARGGWCPGEGARLSPFTPGWSKSRSRALGTLWQSREVALCHL